MTTTNPSRSLRRARAHALSLVAGLAGLVTPTLTWAVDYPGKSALQFASQYIIAPIGLFAVVIAMVSAFFRPEYVSKAIYAVIICAVVFFIIRFGDSIFSVLGQN